MTLKKSVVVASLCLLGACGDDETSAPALAPSGGGDAGSTSSKTDPAKPDAGKSSLPATGSTPDVAPLADGGVAPSAAPGSDAGAVVETPSPTAGDKCDYSKQDVKLAKDLVVAAGKTLHVCAGVTFTAATDVKIDILGELVVDGTSDAPVSFLGAGQPRSWHGLVIEQGGKLTLRHAKIGGAAYGIYAMPGSDFTVDTTEIDTSFKAAVIQSGGRFTHTKFVASTPPTIAVTDDVSVDDPNGTLTIIDASPSISDCDFNGSSFFTDMVRVGGQSSPTSDHVYLRGAHCGFHTSGGTNTSIHVTNSVFDGLAYGVMAYATKPIIENSVFKNNATDVGICNGATNDNTPVLTNNSYSGGMPNVDASCFRIGTTDASPASTANPTAGPSGL